MTRSPNPASRRHGRRGAILLIVLTLLALFAVIGLSFVFYAESQANQSRNYRDSVQGGGSNLPKDSTGAYAPDPQVAVNAVLGQILVPSQVNQDSALYGHELWRLMYGGPLNGVPGGAPGSVPYNGLGLVHQPVTTPLGPFDRADAIRFTRWLSPYGNTGLATQIDPETLYTVPAGGFNVKSGVNLATTPGGAVFVPKNAGYTYPDRNNALLTALDPLHGQAGGGKFSVIAPSGHRPRLFDPASAYGDFGLEPTNPAWYAATGYFQTLRPRPIDNLTDGDRAAVRTALGLPGAPGSPLPVTFTLAQLTTLANLQAQGKLGQFPMPPRNTDGTITGDVQNVRHTNGQQHNDSVWVSIGATPVKFRDTYIVPLVALNLTDLHGRVNVSVAGNVLNLLTTGNTPHSSNQGFGPHEINLQGLLPQEYPGPTPPPTPAGAVAAILARYGTAAGGVPPVPPSYPSEAQAATLVNTPSPGSGTYYPSFPNATGRRVYPVTPFQPTIDASPAFVNTPGASSALNVRQAQPRPESAVSLDGGAGTLKYPGLDLTAAATDRFATVPSNTGMSNSGFNPSTAANVTPGGETVSSPLIYNPYFRAQRTPENNDPTAAQIYPTSDSKRLVARWSDKSTYISDTATARALPASSPFYPAAAGQYPSSVAAQFPTAVANQHRANLTPVSNTLHAPGVAANFFGLKDTAGTRRLLTYTPGGYPFPTLANPTTADLAKIAGTFPTPTAPTFAGGQPDGDASDVTATYTTSGPPTGFAYDAPRTLANVRAALAAVDVNRALPDYRRNLGQPLGVDLGGGVINCYNPTDTVQYPPIIQARQQFALDIFTRLCVATGASVRFDANNTMYLPQPQAPLTVPPTYFISGYGGPNVTVTDAEYSALRLLAQAAANIVDAVDTDDISTAFVWNVTGAGAADPLNFTTTGKEPNSPYPYIQNRVVFGAEKPRVVLNEVYAEMSNTAADNGLPKATSGKYEVRFYLELLHAGTPAPTGTTPVVSDDVQVAPYRVEITNDAATPGNATVPGSLASVSNVLGAPASKPIIQFALNNTDAASTGDPTNNRIRIQPNNGQFNVVDTTAKNLNGFFVVGPEAKTGTHDAPAFMQDTAAFPYLAMLKANPASPGADLVTSTPATVTNSSDSLSYQYQAGPKSGIDSGADKNYIDTTPHTVLLRRLANPYISENTTDNQYVTVDVMSNVKVLDAVAKGTDSTRSPLPAQAKAENHYSLARVQPYTGQVGDPALGVTNSLTLRQTNNPPSTTTPALSFFQHNAQTPAAPTVITGDSNLVTPFEWMPHPDRRLINAEELLNVPVSRPHELTLQFAQPSASGRPVFHQYTLRAAFEQRVTGTAPLVAPTGTTTLAPYYRALELLTVKPWVSDIPHGGRVPGKINVNAIQDKLVFDALLDQNPNNKFTAIEKDELWKQLVLSRSGYDPTTPGSRVLGNTAEEVGTAVGIARPFKSFGVPQFPAATLATELNYNATNPAGTATGVEDTLLRHLPGSTTIPPTQLPLQGAVPLDPAKPSLQPLFSRYGDATRTTTLATTDPLVPYTETEPLRKILNNLTTTSDTFQLVFTVGYFEAREYQPGQPVVLGKEMFLKVPGDLRSQFTAVLDRSLMTTTQTSEVLKVLESREPVPLPASGAISYSNPNPANGDRGLVLAMKPVVAVGAATSTTRTEELVVPGTSMTCEGIYEGKAFTVSPGSILNIGTGANRLQVRAYFNAADTNPNNPSRWAYNPLTGTTRISYEVVTPNTSPAYRNYPAGSMVMNDYTFGPQTAAPLDATTNPAVLYFGRLTP